MKSTSREQSINGEKSKPRQVRLLSFQLLNDATPLAVCKRFVDAHMSYVSFTEPVDMSKIGTNMKTGVLLVRILHFSDAHIDAEIHGKRDPETGWHTQFKDLLRCMDFMVETAVSQDVDAVLFTGDAYHSPKPSPLAQREFIKRIIRLSERNVSVLLLAGNHDLPSAYGEASALDIFNVVKIPGVVFVRRPDVITLATRSGELQIVCLPYLQRRALISFEEERALDSDRIQRLMVKRVQEWVESLMKKTVQNGLPTVLVGHIWVQGAELAGTERVLSLHTELEVPPSILKNPTFSYIALGHVHRHQALEGMAPPIVYAGSLGRLDFGEEKDPKGFVIVDLERTSKGNWEARWQFVQTPTRHFITVNVDVRNSHDPTQAALDNLSSNPSIKGAVVRVCVLSKEEQREQVNLVKIREFLEKQADHIASIDLRVEEKSDFPTEPIIRSPSEIETLLNQSPIKLLEKWLDEVAKERDWVKQKKEWLLSLARKFTDQT